jgi:hypothetical protein
MTAMLEEVIVRHFNVSIRLLEKFFPTGELKYGDGSYKFYLKYCL